ncbi:AarF/UbiB family protein [Phycicoccus ginsengisoli]
MGTALLNVLLLPVQLITVLVVGVLIRRLLGVRVGLVRMVLAGIVALWVAGSVLSATVGVPAAEGTDSASAFLALLLSAGAGSLVAMVLLVLAEVLVPEGSLPGPVELWRGWRGRVERARRYGQITRIATRHGLGRFLRGRWHAGVDSSSSRRQLARSLRMALEDGGVTFVKLGQQLSTRRDLLPEEFVEELARLQDSAAPVPWPVLEPSLAGYLGRPVAQVFATVDPEPMASASVGQVHAARLVDGSEVVVKLQRPGITETVERDLDILGRLARTLESRTEWGRSLGLRDLSSGFASSLREELDFTTEVDNMRTVTAALPAGGRDGIRVPVPRVDLSGRRALVMERMRGTPLPAAQPVLQGLGDRVRRRSAGRLLEAVLDQVLVHGIFHVDLHPGNVLVDDRGTLELLDFGSVGRLDASTRTAVAGLLLALGRGDSRTATDALLELVDAPEQVDHRELERSLGQLLVRYAAPGAGKGADAFTGLFRLVMAHRLRIPPEVAAVFRAVATVEGTLTLIDPDFDLVAETRRSGQDRVGAAVHPGQLRRTVEDDLLAALPVLRRLPRRAERIADSLEHGRLTTNVRLFADPADRRWVTRLVHQGLLTALTGIAGLMATRLLGVTGGPRLTGTTELYDVLGYGLLIVASVLALRVLVVVFRHPPD